MTADELFLLPWRGAALAWRPATGWTGRLESEMADVAPGPAPAPLPPRSRTPRCLTLVLGGGCDLACAYCYGRAGPGATVGGPSPEVLERIASLLSDEAARRGGPLVVGLHGACEPLRDLDLVDRCLAVVRRAAAARRVPLQLFATSSGVLPRASLTWAARNLAGVTLSWDGSAEVHDRLRPRRRGGGSHGAVMEALDVLVAAGLPVRLRSTVTADSLEPLAGETVRLAAALPPSVVFQWEPVFAGLPGVGPDPAAPTVEAFAVRTLRTWISLGSDAARLEVACSRLDRAHGRHCPPWQDNLTVPGSGVAVGCFLAAGQADARLQAPTGGGDPLVALRARTREEPGICAGCFAREHCARGCPQACPLGPETTPRPEGCRATRALALGQLLRRSGEGLSEADIDPLLALPPPGRDRRIPVRPGLASPVRRPFHATGPSPPPTVPSGGSPPVRVDGLHAFRLRDRSFLYAPRDRLVLEVNEEAARCLDDVRVGREPPDSERARRLLEEVASAGVATPRARSRGRGAATGARVPAVLSLFLTGGCNLRCVYCYAHGGELAGRMPWSIARAAVDLLVDRGPPGPLDIRFHGGGEPTLAFELMERVVAHARTRAAGSRRITFGVGTNGVMSDRAAVWIARNLHDATLSIDGGADVHDRQRPLAEGGGSHERALRTARIWDRERMSYGLRATVTAGGVDQLPQIVEELCFQTAARTIKLEPVFAGGRAANTGLAGPDPDRFAEAFLAARPVAEVHGRQLEYSGLRLGLVDDRFCRAAGSSLCVTPSGDVTSCYEVTDRDDPRADRFFFGGWDEEEGRFRLDGARQASQRKLDVDHAAGCEHCFCRLSCAGDCPAKGSWVEGRLVPDPVRCRITRRLTAELLVERLDGGAA